MRVSKRELGGAYLTGTGLILAALLAALLVEPGPVAIGTISIAAGLVHAVVLAGIGLWLTGTELGDDHVWTLTLWGSLGIGLWTLVTFAAMARPGFPGGIYDLELLVPNVALGGIGGVLVGGVREFRRETDQLNQKGEVLARFLQHNLRNDINIVRGHVELLEDQIDPLDGVGPVDHRPSDDLETIKRTLDGMVERTDHLRNLQRVMDTGRSANRPIDAVAFLERRIDEVRRTDRDAIVWADLPDAAWVRGSGLLDAVFANLLQNAVRHHDGKPFVRVSVSRAGPPWSGRVVIRISDNGPGIPADEVEVLSAASETALKHSEGLGLWVAKWCIEELGGGLDIRDNDPRGTVVTVSLPRAWPLPGVRSRRAT